MAAFIPAGLSLIGGALGFLGKKKENNAAHEAGRGTFERDAASQAARARFIQGVMKGYGIDSLIPPDLAGKLTTPTAYPKAVGPSALSGIGGFMKGIAPFIGAGGGQGAGASTLQGMRGSMSGGGPRPEGDSDPYDIYRQILGTYGSGGY